MFLSNPFRGSKRERVGMSLIKLNPFFSFQNRKSEDMTRKEIQEC